MIVLENKGMNFVLWLPKAISPTLKVTLLVAMAGIALVLLGIAGFLLFGIPQF